MRFAVLGPLEVAADDGSPVPINSRAQRLILATLIARRGETVPLDVLVEAVWDDSPPPAAISSLRAQVSRLRRALGDRIVSGPDGYRLDVGADHVDAARFEEACRSARAGEPATAAALLDAALAEWRGRAFGELADAAPVRDEARRLEAARLDAAESRATAALGAGDPPTAVEGAEAVLGEDSLREGAWATLVTALARAGRGADALRAYQRALDALAEVGLEPGAPLRAAEQGVIDTAEATAPPPTGGRLPSPLSPLVGRDDELRRLVDLTGRTRLVTVVGPGGVGKTRLAAAAALSAGAGGRVGARFAALAGIADPGDVGAAVAAALGLADESALDAIGDLDALLVLDNCEHVVEAAAELVGRMLRSGGRVRILATSRERLGVEGEHLWQVAPLSTIGAEAPARVLFRQRALAAAPDARLDEATVARVVDRLDGLPLALEMAAARLTTMALADVADELDEGLGVLRHRRRDVEERHRTLGAVLEWSERLLDEEQRLALVEFSVFNGPVGRDAVAGVLSMRAAVDAVDDLVERSLLVADRDQHHTGYRALSTVRAHGREALRRSGRADAVHGRHAAFYAGALEEIDRRLRTERERAAAGRFAAAFDEVRAAHRWARVHDPALAVRMSVHGHPAAVSGLRGEIVRWNQQLVSLGGLDADGVRAVHACLGAGLATFGRVGEAADHAGRALTGAGDRIDLYATEGLADAKLYAGELVDCERIALDGVALARDLGDAYYVDMLRVEVALSRAYGGDVQGGLAALAGGPESSALSGAGWVAYGRGEVVLDADPEKALGDLERAAAMAAEAGNRYLLGVTNVSLASLRARAGDTGAAIRAFGPLLDHWSTTGDRAHLLTALRNLVTLLVRVERPAAALELAAALAADTSSPTYGAEAAQLDSAVARAADSVTSETAARAGELGASRSLEEACASARTVLAELAGEAP